MGDCGGREHRSYEGWLLHKSQAARGKALKIQNPCISQCKQGTADAKRCSQQHTTHQLKNLCFFCRSDALNMGMLEGVSR